MDAQEITYFGYGSLVNLNTIPVNAKASLGELDGWIREWRAAPEDGVERGTCALTVTPREGVSIRGAMLREPAWRLAELEKRERRYDKFDGIGSAFRSSAAHEAPQGLDRAFLFKAKASHYRWGDAQCPILQTYLDCVLAGFHSHWGEEGVRHFFETTDGWHVPVLQDRRRPLYPRAVELSPELARYFDECLKNIGGDLLAAPVV